MGDWCSCHTSFGIPCGSPMAKYVGTLFSLCSKLVERRERTCLLGTHVFLICPGIAEGRFTSRELAVTGYKLLSIGVKEGRHG